MGIDFEVVVETAVGVVVENAAAAVGNVVAVVGASLGVAVGNSHLVVGWGNRSGGSGGTYHLHRVVHKVPQHLGVDDPLSLP